MSEEDISSRLEEFGFIKSVAGEDFDKVVKAIKESCDGESVGILFTGVAGCGKTTAATVAMKCIRYTHQRKTVDNYGESVWKQPTFRLVKCFCADDVECLREDKLDDPLTYYFLDDIGSELPVFEYGNKIDAVDNFVSRWWEVSANGSPRALVATTNFSPAELTNRYGSRFVDRLMTAVSVVKMSCASHRRRLTMGWSE